MDPKHKKLLQSQRLFLSAELLVDGLIIQYLYQEEILTESHLQEIQSESSSRNKTLKLLDILPSRGSTAFHHFIKSLEKDFPWIRDKLLQLNEEEESPPPPFTGELKQKYIIKYPTFSHILIYCIIQPYSINF